MDKICKLVNDKFSWIMYVDNLAIPINGLLYAEYFAGHYKTLGYTIEWDRDKWKRDE